MLYYSVLILEFCICVELVSHTEFESENCSLSSFSLTLLLKNQTSMASCKKPSFLLFFLHLSRTSLIVSFSVLSTTSFNLQNTSCIYWLLSVLRSLLHFKLTDVRGEWSDNFLFYTQFLIIYSIS